MATLRQGTVRKKKDGDEKQKDSIALDQGGSRSCGHPGMMLTYQGSARILINHGLRFCLRCVCKVGLWSQFGLATCRTVRRPEEAVLENCWALTGEERWMGRSSFRRVISMARPREDTTSRVSVDKMVKNSKRMVKG